MRSRSDTEIVPGLEAMIITYSDGPTTVLLRGAIAVAPALTDAFLVALQHVCRQFQLQTAPDEVPVAGQMPLL